MKLKLTKTTLKKYVQVIGKENFFTGWYYSTSENKYMLGIKALGCGIYNLPEKLAFHNNAKALVTNELKTQWNVLIDNFYYDLCNGRV